MGQKERIEEAVRRATELADAQVQSERELGRQWQSRITGQLLRSFDVVRPTLNSLGWSAVNSGPGKTISFKVTSPFKFDEQSATLTVTTDRRLYGVVVCSTFPAGLFASASEDLRRRLTASGDLIFPPADFDERTIEEVVTAFVEAAALSMAPFPIE